MTPAIAPGADANLEAHHGLAAHEVVLLLETDAEGGLTDAQATERLEHFGPNLLPAAGGRGPLRRFLEQFDNPLIYVLLVATLITFVLGEQIDSAVIFAVVLVNAVIGFVQESRAEAALDALRSLVRTEARIVRNGTTRAVPSDQLVPGDLVLVQAGDKVPADLRLLRLSELQVDESALTGESLPVVKDEVVLPDSTPVADRHNMLYSGTLVTNGTGTGITVATGGETELGEIHRLVGAADVLATPLTRKLARFSRFLTAAILALAVVTFAVGVARGEDATSMFTAAVALAVGAIPEGLPAAVTIALAIGVSRMARRGAVIRRLPAVETLGSTTVICSDKTGTLTENQMTVTSIWTPQRTYTATGAGYAPEGEVLDPDGRPADLDHDAALRWTLLTGLACSDARLTLVDGQWSVAGDPTEGALRTAARKAGLDGTQAAADLPRVDSVAFSSERQYMATQHATEVHEGGTVILVKGALERILALCHDELLADGSTRPVGRDAAHRAAHDLARHGLRVIATARSRRDGGSGARLDADGLAGSLTLTGLQAMLDPPRPAAAAAIRSCHDAGIEVKMITGDHAATAAAVAGQLGLLEDGHDHEVLTGADLAQLEGDDYAAAVDRASVFARVSPTQKLRLVEALQADDHVVAMTGDGVNDAPALRQADIGIAMGVSGTEVAKEASDMILTDDDFATIEAAVEEGRGAFDNLTKFIVWTLPTNMGEGFVILVAILLGTALPILPVQILWINMTTAVLLGLMLAFEPKERGIMSRPPRPPSRSLLTGALLARIALVGALLVAGSWWVFETERSSGHTLEEARTAALNLFVMVELFYLFSCRSLTRSMWSVGLFSNRAILVGVTAQLTGQLAITYLPVMQDVFSTAALDLDAWLRIVAFAALASVVVAIDKKVRRGVM